MGSDGMGLEDIPGRVFLDTSVVNFILDHGEQIHDNYPHADGTGERDGQDIDALYNIFLTGGRAMWQLAISPYTYHEVIRTREPNRRHYLESWFFEIWQYWRDVVRQSSDLPTFIEAEDQRVSLLTSGHLNPLPDLADRVLLCDAIVYRCDLFCTRDWKTILTRRDELSSIPIEVVSPHEWWLKIRPYAGLWA